jgi:hypothetical protein
MKMEEVTGSSETSATIHKTTRYRSSFLSNTEYAARYMRFGVPTDVKIND